MAKELTYDQLRTRVEKLEAQMARREMLARRRRKTKLQQTAEARSKAAARARFKSRFTTRRCFTGHGGSGPCQGGLCGSR